MKIEFLIIESETGKVLVRRVVAGVDMHSFRGEVYYDLWTRNEAGELQLETVKVDIETQWVQTWVPKAWETKAA